MKKLPNLKNITHTTEFFSNMNSSLYKKVIYIIGSFVLIFMGIVFFGKCEEVVSANGVVRPSQNVSEVRTPISGKIKTIYFKDGGEVKKGEKLFSLYCESEIATKDNLVEKIKIVNEKLSEIDLMIKSYNRNTNLLSVSKTIPYTRIKNFFEVKNSLNEIIEIYEKTYETQNLLSEYLTSDEKIKEAERELAQAKLSAKQYCENFLAQLVSEQESYTQQLQNLETNLTQVNTTIENCTIISPIDGTVFVHEKINEEDFLSINQHILSIVPLEANEYEIISRVLEKDIAKMKIGLKARITFSAYSKNEKNITARIENISPDALSNGNSVFYLVTLIPEENENEILYLKPGLQTNSKIIFGEQNIFSYILKKMEINL